MKNLILFAYVVLSLASCLTGVNDTKTSDTGTMPQDYVFKTPGHYREMVLITGAAVASPIPDVYCPGRNLTVPSFSIAQYETTWELWNEVVSVAKDHGYIFSTANIGYQGQNPAGNSGSGSGTSGASWAETERKARPVTYINWRDAVIWCNAYSELSGLEPVYYTDETFQNVLRTSSAEQVFGLQADMAVIKPDANGYRLPYEAEWEYAARGGLHTGPGNTWDLFFAGSDEADQVAWYGTTQTSNINYGAHPVGTKDPNRLDLYDMSGNVWEWCWDLFLTNVILINDVSGPSLSDVTLPPFRSVRGGGWRNGEDRQIVSLRNYVRPWLYYDYLGFRVAANIELQ